MPEFVHQDSPHKALIDALEIVDGMESVLVIYRGKDGKPSGSFDSGLTLEGANYLLDLYKHWLLRSSMTQE